MPIAKEVTAWLHLHGMRINSTGGLVLDRQELLEVTAMLSEAGFLGMSIPHLFMPEAKVVIEPHHHMNYLIYTHHQEEHKTLIRDIAGALKVVELFEKA